MAVTPLSTNVSPHVSTPPDRPSDVKVAARAFEVSFVSEMLKHAGLGKSGVQGADAFSGFLLEAYAERLVEAGGFGLSAKIEASLEAKLATASGTSQT